MEKKIKGSKRGLTFSFRKTKNFEPGSHYRYIIKPDFNEIVIIPSEDGGNTISRKKSGLEIKSLIDLRSKEIKALISEASFMKISIEEDEIVIKVVKEQKNIISLALKKQEEKYIRIPRTLLKAAGAETVSISTGGSSTSSLFQDKNLSSDISDVIRVISLFSGAGMLDYSFMQNPKFDIVYAAEYNKDALETYRKNIGNHIAQVDIRDLKGDELPAADIIIGGPPCQPFSNANRHESARGILHKEGDMFWHYIRLVKECGVKAFLIENVPALLSEKFSYYMDTLRTELPDFKIVSKVVTDSDLGGYTKRKRSVVVGSRIGEPCLPELKLRPERTVKDALLKVDDTWPNATDITKSNDLVKKKISMIPEGGNWMDLPPEYWTRSVHSNMYRRLDRNKPSVALANWRKYLLSPPKWDNTDKWDRILSVSEAAALQGFGKDFVFTGSMDAKQQQVANGVTVAIGNYVRWVIENLFSNFKPVFC